MLRLAQLCAGAEGNASSNACDVIVVGAGFGGMYALRKFRDEFGLKVKVLEQADGVGGTSVFVHGSCLCRRLESFCSLHQR